MPLYMIEIHRAIVNADLFISIETIDVVYPAAGFVHEAHVQGAHTVELNLCPSEVESEFDEKHYGLASKIVGLYFNSLNQDE
jgi:NAD-dependent deacetylase